MRAGRKLIQSLFVVTLIVAAAATMTLLGAKPASADKPPPVERDTASAIAVDTSENVYVTGTSQSPISGFDYATVKYDAAGNLLWVARYDGTAGGDDHAEAMVLDDTGNVTVTGFSEGVGTGWDYVTVKYDGATGEELWADRWDGAGGYDRAQDIAVDYDGNVYVTGYSRNASGPGTDCDYTTIRYSSDGTRLWVDPYDGAGGDDRAYAMAVDSSGDVIVTGRSFNNVGPDTNYDYVTIKYQGASATANRLWITPYDSDYAHHHDEATAIGVDGYGNVYVTGRSFHPDYSWDYCTVWYGSDGNQEKVAFYTGSKEFIADYPYDIAVNSDGEIWVTGVVGAPDDHADFLTINYDSGLVFDWSSRWDGTEVGRVWAWATAVAVDEQGCAYVTGATVWLEAITYYEYETVKYDPDGNLVWYESYSGLTPHTSDIPVDIVVTHKNFCYVTGTSGASGEGTEEDYATIQYNGFNPSGPEWVSRYEGQAPPKVFSVNPDRGYRSEILSSVAITGSNFIEASGVSFGDGIGVDFTVESATRINASISIAHDAALGTRNVSVTTTEGMATLADIFTVTEAQFTLDVTIDGSGSVSKSADPPYAYGDSVQLTATTTEPGWYFAGWSQDLSGSESPTTIFMDGNKEVTAHFTEEQYTLTVTVSPDGSGSVTKDPPPLYTYLDSVQLTATADLGWSFSHWEGDLTGSTNPDTITVDGNKAVTAHFTEDQYTLTVTVSPDGSGSVTRNASPPYTYGDIVQLTAKADPGWSFSHWEGDLSGSDSQAEIFMDGNKAVTAHFTEDQYTLDVIISGSGSDVVTKDPDPPYTYGTIVQLTATTDEPGWYFSHWGEDLSGTDNTAAIIMNEDKTVYAHFTQDPYILTVDYTGAGSGYVIKSPPKARYADGESVELEAIAHHGSSFLEWGGDLSGSAPTTIIMDGHKLVTANFFVDPLITLTVNPYGNGSVYVDPPQTYYGYGQVISLEANPDLGWSFSGWGGHLSGSDTHTSITMYGSKEITAHFTEDHYHLDVDFSGSGSVTKEPNQPTYTYGTHVQLNATADPGWHFTSWSGGLSGSTTPDTITMDGDKAVTANFDLNPPPVITSLSPNWAPQGKHRSVDINGAYFITASEVRFEDEIPGINVIDYDVIDPNLITASIYVDDAAAIRPWDVSITTIGGTGTGHNVFTVTEPTKPPAPELISPVDGDRVGGSDVLFQWNDVPEATSYHLVVCTKLEWWKNPCKYNSNVGYEAKYMDSGYPDDGTNYYWWVWGMNSAGQSDWEDDVEPKGGRFVSGEVPIAPELVSPDDGEKIDGEFVTFQWNRVPGATNYHLLVTTDPEWPWDPIKTSLLVGNVTTYEDTGYPDDGTTYYWWVWGINSFGKSPFIEVEPNGRSFISGIIPAAPALLAPFDGTNVVPGDSINFQWSTVPEATSYTLIVNTQPNPLHGTPKFVGNVGDATTYEDSGYPADGTIYYWWVWGINDVGQSPWPDVQANGRCAFSGAVPAAPELVSPDDGAIVTGTSINFQWNSVPRATSYALIVNTQPNPLHGTRKFVGNVGNVTTYTDYGYPDDGTIYHWWVWGLNDVGQSPWPDVSANGRLFIDEPDVEHSSLPFYTGNYTGSIGYEGIPLTLYAGNSTDSDGNALQFRWDFDNDGVYDTEWSGSANVSHAWDDDYSGAVELEVTDGQLTSTKSSWVIALNLIPVVGQVSALIEPVQVNTPVHATGNFTDPGFTDTHTAEWDWDDGTTSAGTVTETDGVGVVTDSHTYSNPGVYEVRLTVTDDDGDSASSVSQYVVVYDPGAGFVTGGGWIDSPQGAYAPDPSLTGKASFGFVSKYKKGATVPTGQTEFQFRVANLNFHSYSYDWLVIAGHKAMYKGTGTINGEGNYGFMLSAIDESLTTSTDVDMFRIKIWDKDNDGTIIYDNQIGDDDDADPTTEISGGSILIQKK